MDLIPQPRRARTEEDAGFELGRARLVVGDGAEGAARWIRAVLAPATGVDFDGDGGTVRLGVDAGLGPEAYRLTVDKEKAEVTGGDAAGVFWGVQTMRQLLPPAAFRRSPVGTDRQWTLPVCDIADRPRFRWRGFMLDVARHFMPKDGILRHLDLMAVHKLNVLHLHLTDDQGWRPEIIRYPRLTEVGAWRQRTRVGLREPPLWDERPHGGYYTRDDLREIVAYAAVRHITVVPEIDIPGHSQAAIAAYPELGNTDVVDTAALPVLPQWGVNPNVLAPTEATLRFYENVLTELLDVFPGTFFHIGGDECPKDQWQASPTAQARIAELGVRDEDGLQSALIRHFDRWLADRGRRLIGWDEILEGGLAEGAAVSSWRGFAGGVAAARAGHDVVMCPQSQVYLDWRQADGPDEPVPIAHVRTLEDVYRFEPVPDGLTAAEAEHVMGTQANVWTEVLDSARAVDYAVYPRLAALAEVAWSLLPAPAERDWPGFRARMRTHYARLDALGVEYRPPGGPRPWQRRPGVPGRPKDGPPPIV